MQQRVTLIIWPDQTIEVFGNLRKLCNTYKQFRETTILYHWRQGKPYYKEGVRIERKDVTK
jgi:hypothetical protein